MASITPPTQSDPQASPEHQPEHAASQVGNLELDQLFLEREKLNGGIATALDEATQPWGIRVFRYEI